MFTNLIESDSHAKEFKRRSSFFAATVAAYALFLFAAAVAGVLTYDAQVEAQTNDLGILEWIPPASATSKPDTPRDLPRQNRKTPADNVPIDQTAKVPERINPTTPTTDPTKVPEKIGTEPSDAVPVTGPVVASNRNVNSPTGPETGGNCTTCTGSTGGSQVEQTPTPAPTPVIPAGPKQVPSTLLMAKVIDLPKPAYPIIAKNIKAQGAVNVQILVDEGGRVISAHAVSGNPILIKAAEEAARRARFTPTMLGNQPVKVQGVITYNFILQ